MFQLEPMMAEENSNADSYDGRDGVSQTVFVWGETILVNIEGKIQKIITSQLREVQPDKKIWQGEGRACHTPQGVGEALFNCGITPGMAQKKPPMVEYGGGAGGVHRGIDQTRHYTSPIPPPEKPTLHGMGGGLGVFTVASPKPTALNIAYLPTNFTVALPKHGTERCLSPP